MKCCLCRERNGPRSDERLPEPRDHPEVGVLPMLAGGVLRYQMRYLPERLSGHLT